MYFPARFALHVESALCMLSDASCAPLWLHHLESLTVRNFEPNCWTTEIPATMGQGLVRLCALKELRVDLPEHGVSLYSGLPQGLSTTRFGPFHVGY
jgi:hypothetical protein